MGWTRGPLAALAAALTAASAAAQQPPAETPPASPPAAATPATALSRVVQAPRVQGGDDNSSGGIAVVVNDEVVTNYDVRQRMLLLYTLSGIQPSEQNLQQFQQQALRSLLEERLQTQELRRVGRERSLQLILEDRVVDQDIAETAREAGLTTEQFAQQLQLRGISLAEMREYRRAQLSWTSFVRAYFRTRVAVSQTQIDAALERLRQAQNRPQYQISEIYIDPARVGGVQEAQFGAAQLVAQLQQGAPFTSVARQFSAASTAARGGDAGWVSAADLAPEVAAAVEQMRPSQISAPITTATGVYIVALRDRRSGAGDTLVRLKQAAVRLTPESTPEQITAAEARLAALRPSIANCEGVEAAVQAAGSGILSGDLGEIRAADLAPEFRTVAEQLQPGQVSTPIRTSIGVHLIVLCGRRQTENALPSRSDLENRLRGEQYSLYARRYLRDLQNSAIVEGR